MEPQKNDYSSSSENISPNSHKKREKNNAKLFIIILLSLSLILVARYIIVSQFDAIYAFFKPEDSENDPDSPPIYAKNFYTPDWSTDIFTLPEYLQLNRTIKYSNDDGKLTQSVPENKLQEFGGRGLVFMSLYFNTVIQGDHETLNTLFTDNFWEDNEKYSDFPMQKIHNIKIIKRHHTDSTYPDTSDYDVVYYTVSYSIYKNDGLFRSDIDSEGELTQGFWILLFPDNSAKIDKIISLKGVVNQ